MRHERVTQPTVFEREGSHWDARPHASSFDRLPELLWKHGRVAPDSVPGRGGIACTCGWVLAEDAPNPTASGWHRTHLADVIAAYVEEEKDYALADERDRYDRLVAARAEDIRFKLEYFEALKASEIELAGLRSECDKVGVPHDAEGLVRHHVGSTVFKMGINQILEERTAGALNALRIVQAKIAAAATDGHEVSEGEWDNGYASAIEVVTDLVTAAIENLESKVRDD